jgi:hypothetical protein
MNVRHQHDEPEKREGFGGRVRRFIDSELSRALDKDDRATREPVDAEHGAAAHPAATAPAEPTPVETTPVETTPVETTPAETTMSGRRDDRRMDQAAADGSAERVGLLNDPAGLRHQWQQVQGTFVDDPQRAVHEASVLVDRTLREIHENVSRAHSSDPTSTEDLRVSFQRYREFFQRLLSA